MRRRSAPWLVRLAILVWALALTGTALRAATYALVIGIDDYAHIPKLQGAVNDARDIADALSGLPRSEVVLLLDDDADRETILATWRRFASQARPRDTIVVTFAGHGANEPAAYPETEADGRDETLLLAGFSPTGPGAGERIRDDEIAELIALTPQTQVIIVADSCHSGTATRASRHDLAYRFFKHGKLADDPLPPPPPPPPNERAQDMGDANNTVFFAAVSDSEKAPEIPIDGAVRGALSYSFANGIRGAADHNGDGVVAKGELELHVRQFVKQATAGRQKPQVAPAGKRRKELFNLKAPARVDARGPFAKKFDRLPPIPIRSVGPTDSSELLKEIDGAVLSTPDQDDVHSIVVNVERRLMRTVHGDILRRLFGRSEKGFKTQIQETVDKMRGVQAIQAAQVSGSLDVWFPLGDEVYLVDDPIILSVDGRTHPFVSIVNIPSDGTLEWLYPVLKAYQPNARFEDPARVPPRTLLELTVGVVPPFGSDHILVIETPRPQDSVYRVLADYNLTTDFRALWDDLHNILAGQAHNVAVHAFFSKRRQTQ